MRKFAVPGALIKGAICICILLNPGNSWSQQTSRLDSLYAELDELFAEDSLGGDLFSQTDSLLSLMDMRIHSLNIRSSFTSEVLTSGRDLGYSQNGFITGLSYYHPSGIYGEVTGYLNSGYSPQYYMTDAGVGYLLELDKWLLQAGHNFQFFDSSVDWVFNKNAQLTTYYQRKKWEAGIDYRFMYGKEQAHRITTTLASRISWTDFGWFDRISLIPSVAVQWGNANIIYYRQSETPLRDLYQIILSDDQFPDIERRDMVRLSYLLQRERIVRAIQLLSELGYTGEMISDLLQSFEESQFAESNSFGLMNIALHLGLSLSKERWNLYANYSCNFPQSLPGEEYSYENNDYLSISLFYTLFWPAAKP